MNSLIATWLDLSLFDRVTNVILLILFVTFLGYASIKFLKALRNHGVKPELRRTDKGWKIGLADTKTPSLPENPLVVHRIPFTQHSVFFTLKKMIERGIDLTGSDISPEKEKLSKVFLEDCLSTVFYDRLQAWVQALEEKAETPGDCEECMTEIYTISDKIYSWIEEYNQKARAIDIVLPDGNFLRGIPEIFIEKFDMWHEIHIETIIARIRQVLYSDFYVTWQLKLILILDHLDTVFILTEYDAKKTLSSLNGDLEDKILELKRKNR